VGEHPDGAPRHLGRAGDHPVARRPSLRHPERGDPVPDPAAELLERRGVREDLDATARLGPSAGGACPVGTLRPFRPFGAACGTSLPIRTPSVVARSSSMYPPRAGDIIVRLALTGR
jgi:hypothetical protein